VGPFLAYRLVFSLCSPVCGLARREGGTVRAGGQVVVAVLNYLK
jgi:hypothetical protein